MENVAFVGLGAIGRPMAGTLLDAGFGLVVFDVVEEARRELVERGAAGAESAEEAAARADATVVMVATPEQAVEAIFGDGGAASGLSSGKTLLLASTVGPETAREIGGRLAGSGVLFLDCPVSGGTARARAGELLVMAGGEDTAFDAALPVLRCIGTKIERVGEKPGDGQSMKLVNQLLCGVHLAAAGEALAFARALGLDPAEARRVVSQGAAYSFMLDDRAERMLSDGPVGVESAMDIFVKDTGLVLDAARENGFEADLAAAANGVFREGAEAGMGRDDDSRVEAVYRARTAHPGAR